MPIKDINQMINDGVNPRRTTSNRSTLRRQIQNNINNASSMKDVVPPLHRGDFLNKWKEDRKELERVRTERDKVVEENKQLKKQANKIYSQTWGNYHEETKRKV